MVGPSKILTVSYGTFSCTLEGFDDPFATMRGIAEYFRDLAADDRYFGAEPPTPDAEMLHRIAQRDITRRVEARVGETGIVLRQTEEEADSPTPAPARSVAAATQVADRPAPKPQPEQQRQFRSEAPVETYEFSDASPVRGESVAAKLARIRAAVARREDDAGLTYRDDSHVPHIPPAATLADAFEDEVAETPAPVETPAPQTSDIAEQTESQVTEAEEEIFEETAEAATETVVVELETLSFTEESLDDELVEDEQETAVDDEETVETALDDEDTAIDDEEDDVELAADSFQGVTHADLDDVEDQEEVEDEEDEVALAAEDDATDDVDDADEIGRDAIARVMSHMSDSDDADELLADEETSDEPDAPAIARVIKMRRVDLEAEEDDTDSADTAESLDDETPDDEDDATTQNHLSDEDEADLMATLEQVRRDSEAEGRADKEGRAVLENDDLDHNGNGVQRILEVTNTELEQTEGTRRRSAIQHLKAAVLATRADKKLVQADNAEDDAKQMDQYRDDLARVVRPRRPADGVKPSERRQAPLVLVTEQRVDVAPQPPVDANAEAIRPRRISASLAADPSDEGNENIFADANSFAEFAEQMDATELPDLLEAAAAYASYVEGRPHFSRPQIMRAVAAFGGDDEFNREDTLRSFGQLLRHGKIRKLSRGQFTVNQSTRFNPGARAAGE